MRNRKVTFVTASILGLSLCAFVLYRVSKAPCFQLFGDLYCHVRTSQKLAALTFDDGPNENNTPVILDILDRHKIKATFFMVGENIAKHPELAAQVVARGHQLANHSYTHKRMVFKSVKFIHDELESTDALIRRAGYKGEIYFRPPYGKRLFGLPWILSQEGRKTITWDSESEDTSGQDPDILKKNILDHVRPGSIILFHDGGRLKPGTLTAVEAVIQALQSEGYRLVTVMDLIAEADR